MPVEALPCGSVSKINTPFPAAAKAVPRLMAVVVLPTPPFWLAIAKARMSHHSFSEPSELRGLCYANNAAARIA